jgi:hypothetical protein
MLKYMGPSKLSKQQIQEEWDSRLEAEIQKIAHHGDTLKEEWAVLRQRVLDQRKRLFPYQLKFLLDPAKNKGVVSTRRSGKTKCFQQMAMEAVTDNFWSDVMRSQPVVQYVTTTQKKALDLFWRPFRRACEQLGLEAHWDDHNLRALFTNGVLVRASGVATGFDIEAYRGDAYVLVLIDEAASLGPKLESLLVEGLGMAMADYQGTRAVVGTPGRTKSGFLYEAVHGLVEGWTFHPKWDFRDNPTLSPETKTDEWIRLNVGPLTSARVRREAFGEWVTDASELVYQFSTDRNTVLALPPIEGEWNYALGLDLGFRDPTAWTVVAWCTEREEMYVVLSDSKSGMTASEIFEKIQELQAKYNFKRIVADGSGSMARNSIDDWNVRGQLGIIPAQKSPGYKLPAMQLLNSDFVDRKVLFLEETTRGLQKELLELPWDEEKPNGVKHARHDQSAQLKEHPGYANHMCDSLLYVSRESRHYLTRRTAPLAAPSKDSASYWRDMATRDYKRRVQELEYAAQSTEIDSVVEGTWDEEADDGHPYWIER